MKYFEKMYVVIQVIDDKMNNKKKKNVIYFLN